MSLTDILDKIRSLVSAPSLDDTIKSIDTIIPYQNKGLFSDLISSALSSPDVSKILSQDASSIMSFQYEADRIARYQLYKSIYKRIPQCKRAIKVIVANILSPDTVSKKTIDIVIDASVEVDINLKAIKENFEIIAKKIQLPQKARRIINSTLICGDYFVYFRLLGQESSRTKIVKEGNISIELEEITSVIKEDASSRTQELLKDLPNVKTDRKISNKQLQDRLSQLYIKLLDPDRVISLTIEDVCFGYLVLPTTISYSGIVNSKQMKQLQKLQVAQQIINKLIGLRNLPSDQKEHLRTEIERILERMQLTTSTKILYVPPENMQHFKIPSAEYEPYGESVFSGVELDAKILMALKTALAIHRINASTERRIIAVEIGLPRNAANSIENLKNTLRRRRVTLDSFGTLDAIPSTLGTFENIYLPMKDGRRFIEFDRLDNLVDVTAKVDEIKTFRDSVVSGTGVPPLFVGIDEIEKKATASHQNILFTRDIVDYQEIFTIQFNEFLYKIYKLVIPEDSDYDHLQYISVHFPPPKNLQLEMTSELVSSVSSMISSLKDLDIPVEYLTKTFLSNLLDFDEIEKYKQKQKMEGKTKEEVGSVGGGF